MIKFVFFFQSKEDEDFSDVAECGVVDVVGDDAVGRKIIVVSACKLPSNKEVDHPRLLRYNINIHLIKQIKIYSINLLSIIIKHIHFIL